MILYICWRCTKMIKTEKEKYIQLFSLKIGIEAEHIKAILNFFGSLHVKEHLYKLKLCMFSFTKMDNCDY